MQMDRNGAISSSLWWEATFTVNWSTCLMSEDTGSSIVCLFLSKSVQGSSSKLNSTTKAGVKETSNSFELEASAGCAIKQLPMVIR